MFSGSAIAVFIATKIGTKLVLMLLAKIGINVGGNVVSDVVGQVAQQVIHPNAEQQQHAAEVAATHKNDIVADPHAFR